MTILLDQRVPRTLDALVAAWSVPERRGARLDAWVFELPADAPGAGAPVKATGSDLLGLHNLAVVFLSDACEVVGQLDTQAADEAGVLPVGTRFVVVSDRSGIGTTVSLTVG